MSLVGMRRSTRVFVPPKGYGQGRWRRRNCGEGSPLWEALHGVKAGPGKKADGENGDGAEWLRVLDGGGDTADEFVNLKGYVDSVEGEGLGLFTAR